MIYIEGSVGGGSLEIINPTVEHTGVTNINVTTVLDPTSFPEGKEGNLFTVTGLSQDTFADGFVFSNGKDFWWSLSGVLKEDALGRYEPPAGTVINAQEGQTSGSVDLLKQDGSTITIQGASNTQDIGSGSGVGVGTRTYGEEVSGIYPVAVPVIQDSYSSSVPLKVIKVDTSGGTQGNYREIKQFTAPASSASATSTDLLEFAGVSISTGSSVFNNTFSGTKSATYRVDFSGLGSPLTVLEATYNSDQESAISVGGHRIDGATNNLQVSGSTFTLQSEHLGKTLIFTNIGAGCVVTIPNNLVEKFSCELLNESGGDVTFSVTSPATLLEKSGSLVVTANELARLSESLLAAQYRLFKMN